MQYWQNEVASLVIALVCRANHGKPPLTCDEWQEVAERLCCDLCVVRTRSSRIGVVLDAEITVKYTQDANLLNQRIAHEMAEYLLASEWEAPYRFVAPDSERQRHEVAQIVQSQFPRDEFHAVAQLVDRRL